MFKPVLCLLVILCAALGTPGQPILPAAGDSLAVVPARPTSVDRITFNLIIKNWDCCTHYTFDSTVTFMADTQILLSYQYNLPQMCPAIACLDVDKVLPFKSAPLAAGTYGVYESKSVLCTAPPCPLLAMPIMAPVRIGEVVVSKSTGIVRFVSTNSSLNPRAQNTVKEIFNARGERLNSSLASQGFVRGVCFVRTARGQGVVQKVSPIR